MTLPLCIVVIVVCLVFLIAVARQVQSGRLLLRYSLLWIALALIAILGAIFPGPVYALSSFLGFENPSNFIFFAGLFFLLVICLSLSLIVSKQASRIKDLVQELALLDKEGSDARRQP